MKKYCLLIFVISISLYSCAQETEATAETSTFYFIRHAEKDRTNEENSDPKLKEAGILRAARWSLVLENVKFDAVYSTDYNRTRQTAQPTAEKNGLKLTLYDPSHLDGKAFLEANRGKNVLVVGHSNTTPQFVNAVLGTDKYQDMDDNDNASIFIVTVSPSGEMSAIVLVVD